MRGAQKIVSGEGRCYRGKAVSFFLFPSQSSAFILHRNHHTTKLNSSGPSATIYSYQRKNLSDSFKLLFFLLDIIKSYHEVLEYTMPNAAEELTGLAWRRSYDKNVCPWGEGLSSSIVARGE